jgi:hypothetical protein
MMIILTIAIVNGMLDYDFMRNAFAAAGVAAVVSGLVGYFLVLRGQTFAGHALGHIGFAGATGAILIGLTPVWGLVGFTVAAGIGMGMMGERVSGRDVAIGVVLSLSLGFGLLFLHYYTAFAAQATTLLFGNVLAVDRSMIATLIGLALVTLAALATIMRPLIFASLQPELAEAKGHRLPGNRRTRGFGERPDRRHSPGFQLYGGPAGDSTAAGHWPVERNSTLGRARLGRGLARHRHGLSYGLAGQLLHRTAERARLVRQPRPTAPSTLRTARRCGVEKEAAVVDRVDVVGKCAVAVIRPAGIPLVSWITK